MFYGKSALVVFVYDIARLYHKLLKKYCFKVALYIKVTADTANFQA